jgi:hypothetical protein
MPGPQLGLRLRNGWQAACELTDHKLLRSVARQRGVRGRTPSAPCPRYPTTRSFFSDLGKQPGLALQAF